MYTWICIWKIKSPDVHLTTITRVTQNITRWYSLFLVPLHFKCLSHKARSMSNEIHIWNIMCITMQCKIYDISLRSFSSALSKECIYHSDQHKAINNYIDEHQTLCHINCYVRWASNSGPKLIKSYLYIYFINQNK